MAQMNASNLNVRYMYLGAFKVSAFQADPFHRCPLTAIYRVGGWGCCCLHAKVLLQSGLKD